MFAPTSRYADLPTRTTELTAPDGTTRTVTYVSRRMLPPSGALTVVGEHVVAPAERLDHIAARHVGDPTQFWRLCDGTDVLRPAELEVPGRRLPLSMPSPAGG